VSQSDRQNSELRGGGVRGTKYGGQQPEQQQQQHDRGELGLRRRRLDRRRR